MCEVCKSTGVDYRFKNGSDRKLNIDYLYKVFKDSIVPIKLCYVHSIELFSLGERRFLMNNLTFARQYIWKNGQKSSSEHSAFGL